MRFTWKERLAEGLGAPEAVRQRRLFQELNPGADHSPILKQPPTTPRPAAVMIGIRDTADPTIILTLRASTMPSHAGQISLPGGTPKEDDDGPIGTALRETDEEIGVPPAAVNVRGVLGEHFGGLGYVVTPVVGLIDPSAEILPCPREVDQAFEVSFDSIVDPRNHVIQDREFAGQPYKMFAVPVEDTDGRHRNIWGLTAGILLTLSEIVHGSN